MNAECLWRFVGVALLAPTCVAAQEPLSRQGVRSELLGCWALLDRESRPAYQVLGHWVPPLVLLVSDADRSYWLENYPTARRAVRLDSSGRDQDDAPTAPRSRWHAALWTADSLSDSIRLKFGDGRTGVSVQLAAPRVSTRDTLTGTAELGTDVAYLRPRAFPVQAIRARCP